MANLFLQVIFETQLNIPVHIQSIKVTQMHLKLFVNFCCHHT